VSPDHGHCHPSRPAWFKTLSGWVARRSKNAVLQSVEREIADSDHDLAKLRAWHPRHARKFQRIYHSRLSGPPPLSDGGGRKPAVLYAGHVAWRKGQPVLAQAFARIAGQFPEWELWFAGDIGEASAARAVEQTAREHGLAGRIHLLGRRNDVATLMQQASLYVQPSLEEALGLALQEAMWHGLPCIGSNVGGIPELITPNHDGLLVPPGASPWQTAPRNPSPPRA
jgi:glycosyltransferase involved in cell wall biosynthesis